MTQKNYFKSHKEPQNARIIPTYELKPVNMNEDLNEKTHFYWMSGSAFKLALKNYPKIINANHSCGPGNTLKTIKKYINKNNINVFLSYEDALKNITRPGDKK